MVDTTGWSGKKKPWFDKKRWCNNERSWEKVGVLKVDGNMAGTLARIILTGIERQLRVAVAGKQAAEQSLAGFISLALQAVNIAAEKQAERLPQQNGERKARQFFSHFDECHDHGQLKRNTTHKKLTKR